MLPFYPVEGRPARKYGTQPGPPPDGYDKSAKWRKKLKATKAALVSRGTPAGVAIAAAANR